MEELFRCFMVAKQSISVKQIVIILIKNNITKQRKEYKVYMTS